MDEIKQQIRQFLSELLPEGKSSNLGDDTPLRSSGILDSVGMLGLVSFIEERFRIEVEAYEASSENFDRIDDIAVFIQRKQAVKA
jgi:acyl carrier protein